MATCPLCKKYFDKKKKVLSHMEKMHPSQIPENMSTIKYYYALNHNGETTGKCRICSDPTDFDEVTGRVKVLCNNPKCKEVFAKLAQSNNMRVLGIAFPAKLQSHQMKMLANRKISGTYKWSDDKTEIPYVGSYERRFLEFLDNFLGFDPATIHAPCPIDISYEFEGETLQHTPDFYIDILDLIIEIKQGGANPNMHPKIQAVDAKKDAAKEAAIKKYTTHNYIKIVDNDFKPFLEIMANLTDQRQSGNKSRLFIINESSAETVDGNNSIKYMIDPKELYFVVYGSLDMNDLHIAASFNSDKTCAIIYDTDKFRYLTDEEIKTLFIPSDVNTIITYRYTGENSLYKQAFNLANVLSRNSAPYESLSEFDAFAKVFSPIFDEKINHTVLDYMLNIYLTRIDATTPTVYYMDSQNTIIQDAIRSYTTKKFYADLKAKLGQN